MRCNYKKRQTEKYASYFKCLSAEYTQEKIVKCYLATHSEPHICL